MIIIKSYQIGKDVRTPPSLCPRCETELDGAQGMGNNETPREGAIALCWYCGQLSYYEKDLALRRMTHNEQEELFEALAKDQPEDLLVLLASKKAAEERWIDG